MPYTDLLVVGKNMEGIHDLGAIDGNPRDMVSFFVRDEFEVCQILGVQRSFHYVLLKKVVVVTRAGH